MPPSSGPRNVKPVKVRRAKPTVVKPPAGDIASSGGGYGLKRAAPTVKRELKQIRVRQSQVKDVKSNADLGRAKTYAKAHPVKAKGKGGVLGVADSLLSGKLTQGAVSAAEKAASTIAPYVAAAELPAISATAHALGQGSTFNKVAKNTARDVVDLPANAVPSMYVPIKLAAQGHPGKAAKMLAQPFEDTFGHGVKGFTKAAVAHPLGTALLLRGGEGAIGHGAGRIMRTGVLGKTAKAAGAVEREVRTIPNTRVTHTKVHTGDVLAKGARHVTRKVRKTQARTTMSTHETRGRVNADVQAAKVISSEHEHDAARAAKAAIGKKPTAAVTLAAQGITNATRADLERYLSEIRAEHPNLVTQDERTANERLQAQIAAALKSHNDEQVRSAAQAYSNVRSFGEGQVVAHKLVKPDVAEQTRLAGAAVRQGASVAARKTAVAATKQARESAKRVKVRARQDVANADKAVQQAIADARVSNVRAKTSPALKAAERERSQAQARLASIQRAGVKKAEQEVQGAKGAAERAAGRRTTEAQVQRQSAERGLATAKGRAEVLSRNVGGKAGGYGIELAQRGVAEATRKVRTTRGGVPPAEADALRRALAARDEAAAARAENVRGARAAVRAADAKVNTELARIRGVAPKEADQLLNAIHERDVIRVTRTQAVAGHKAARGAHIEAKTAPFADETTLQPVTTAQVRARMGPNAIEPAFVTHSPIQRRSAALPSEKPTVPVKINRSGEAVRKGTIDAHPAALVEQAMASSRLLDAAKSREKFIEDFGYRAHSDDAVQAFKQKKTAEGHAALVKDATGVEWEPVQRQDGTYAVVPHEALSQLRKHEAHVSTHPVAKLVTSQWRRNVLAFSPRWLTGNVLEAGLRSLVAGAGPLSYVSGRRTLAQLKRIDPEAYREARARMVGGGNYAVAERVAQERVVGEDLAGFAKAAHKLRTTPGPKQVADAYGHYMHFVFNTLNGRLESQFQTAMLGRALRDHPLMDGKVLKFSQKAAEDAAHGLTNTDAQVELGRAIDRMYGQYQKFGPGARAAIAMYTPFIAWTYNAMNFLYHVLPVDHPVITALIASSSQATEEWRKQKGLYMDFFGQTTGQLPPWLQGSIPGSSGSRLRLSRYTPFGLLANDSGTPAGGLPSLLLPQLSEIMANLQGKDFTNSDLSKNPSGARDMIAAVSAFLEGQIPAAAQAAQIAGKRLPNQRDSMKIRGGLNRTLNPFVFTPASNKPKGAKSSDPLLAKYGLSGSGSSLDDLAKKYGLGQGSSVGDLAKKYGLGK